MLPGVLDPDPYWIRIRLVSRTQIRICIQNADPDPHIMNADLKQRCCLYKNKISLLFAKYTVQ
jgi:hypothetical protein